MKRPARRDETARSGPGRSLRAPALPVDSSLFFKLVRVVNLTARPFSESIGRAHQLGLNAWRVLIVVASRPGVAATEVASLTGLDKMAVSRAVAELIRAGRVVRRIDAADRRRMRLQLSAEGRRLYASIGAPARQREQQLFRGIGAAEQKRLDTTLDRLIANVAPEASDALP